MEMSSWDRQVEYINETTGFKTTLYNINVVAIQLGRTSQTIRKWEIAGIIPKTPFTSNGKRLYCKEQIEILVKCAEKAQICTGRKISATSFTTNVERQWSMLFKKIFGK